VPVAIPIIKEKTYRVANTLANGIEKNMKADTINDPRMDLLYPMAPDKSPEKNIEIP
jgi:hypothetical protein